MQKSDIHIFDYEGRQILLQIETGSFFEVSRLVAQILRSDENSRREDLVADLSPNHGFEAVVEALSELEAADLISFGPVCPLVDSGDGAVVPPTRSSAETITITLHVSHACNVTCTYCFALGGDYGGEPKLMKWETAKQAVDWLVASTREAGKCQIDFFGGEPLLHLDLVKQTVAYAREHGEANGVEVSFGMTTNGTLLTGDALEFLMQEDIGIMVSIDGPKKVHDAQRSFNNGESTYDIVAANTSEAARRAPEKVLLRATMTNENLDMKGLVDELEGFKVNSVGVGAA